MKIRSDFVMREVAGSYVVVPCGKCDHGVMKLNESGAFLWKILEKGADKDTLLSKMLAEYDVSEEKATADIDAFLKALASIDAISEK